MCPVRGEAVVNMADELPPPRKRFSTNERFREINFANDE